MALVKEPKDVDLTIQSKPWTEEELAELSVIILKSKERKLKKRKTSKAKNFEKTGV